MEPHYTGIVALVIIVSVSAIFLLPVASGPFSAVHGPVTLRAIRLALLLQWTLTFCGKILCPVLRRTFWADFFCLRSEWDQNKITSDVLQLFGFLRC